MGILCAVLVINVNQGFATDSYIPTHSLDDCMDDLIKSNFTEKLRWLRTQTLVSFAWDSVVVMALLLMTYSLRTIPQEYNIMQEMKFVAFIQLVSMGIYNFIVAFGASGILVTGQWYVYVSIGNSFLCMLVSGVYLLRQTKNANADIVPFPVNSECINNFELAIIMPLPMTHFYWYLENCVEDYHEALFIFGLHSDITAYMRMNEQRDIFSSN